MGGCFTKKNIIYKVKFILIFTLICGFYCCLNAQTNLYKPWLNRKYESNVISTGVCSPAGECSWKYQISLLSDGSFTSNLFNNQSCYAFTSSSNGVFEVKDSIFTLKSIIPDSVLTRNRDKLPLDADRFIDETGTKLVIRKRKLYLLFPNEKENGYLLLKPKISIVEIKKK